MKKDIIKVFNEGMTPYLPLEDVLGGRCGVNCPCYSTYCNDYCEENDGCDSNCNQNACDENKPERPPHKP